MEKKLFVWTTVLMIIFGLVLLTSCAREEVRPETTDLAEPQEDLEEQAARAEAEAEAAAEEAAIRAQELEERALRQEKMEARQAFVSEDINFDFDKSEITPAAQKILKRKADWLRDNSNVNITVEGHCDERGTAEYNLALGDRRAKSARNFLVDLGIDATRLKTISYGEERPLDPRSNEEAWAKNRRANFVIR